MYKKSGMVGSVIFPFFLISCFLSIKLFVEAGDVKGCLFIK